MNMLYITRRPLGLIGTPGTYLAIKGYSQYYNVYTISIQKEYHHAIVQESIDKYVIENLQIDKKDNFSHEIIKKIQIIEPQFICIATWGSWYAIVKAIRKSGYKKPIFLEIKSPPLLEGDKLSEIQNNSYLAQFYLNGIIALSHKIAQSWLKKVAVPMYQHKLMLDSDHIKRVENNVYFNKIKCIYVGALAEKRKLNRLLEILADLPDQLKNIIQVDFYGSGPDYDNLINIRDNLGLSQIVNFLGYVSQNELYNIYPQYRIGIAWVPGGDYFKFVPSLKLSEYIASGLIPIATDTIGHRTLLLPNEKVYFFNENSSLSFSETFKQAIKQNLPFNSSDKIDLYSYKKITQEILDFYKNQRESSIIFNNAPLLFNFLNVVYISPRPFGVIGTPGTYLFSEAYSLYTEFTIISNSNINDNEYITFEPSPNIKQVKFDFSKNTVLNNIIDCISSINPDLVILGSWPKWHWLASNLKNIFSKIKIALEIKSPLIVNENKELRQNNFFNYIKYLDFVISPEIAMAKTWFGISNFEYYGIKNIEHRQVVDFNNFELCQSRECEQYIKIIFVGSITVNREIDVLIHYINNLPDDILNKVVFDFYGTGNYIEQIKTLINKLQLDRFVKIKGAVSQEYLFKIYSNYHIGLAWVPNNTFDTAPSLKLLEYCCAGIIPIATNNYGHSILSTKWGFEVNYFDHNSYSFAELLRKKINEILELDIFKLNKNNINRGKAHHYINVIKDEILPFYINNIAPGYHIRWLKHLSQSTLEISNLKSKFETSNAYKNILLNHKTYYCNKLGCPDEYSNPNLG